MPLIPREMCIRDRGNGYDKEPEPVVPAWEQKKKVKGFDLHPDVDVYKRQELDYADSLKRTFQSVHIFISSDTEEDVEIIKNTFERWRESQ